MLAPDLRRIEGALRFIEHQDVLGGNLAWSRRVALDVVVDMTNEGLPTSARSFQLVLQDLDEWSVSGQKHGGSCGATIRAGCREVV
jgi:hypothetical protein